MTREAVLTLIRDHLVDELEVAPERITEATHFRDDLSADSLELVRKAGFEHPTPVQAESIPVAIAQQAHRH